MKLRIRGNSVRLRLTKSEVEQFCNEGTYTDTVDFGPEQLTYSLVVKEGIHDLVAEFTNNAISVFTPLEVQQEWYSNDRVGYSAKIITMAGNELSLLVEKDFVCMDESVEDQSDNYPNPKM